LSERYKVLSGTALRIYLLLLGSNKPLGVRELQRYLKLKSPSTVKYHLDRLRMNGLVKQLPDGKYIAIKADNPLINLYVFIRATPIPKLIPIAIFFATFNIVYTLLSNEFNIVLLLSSIIFSIYVIYEGLKLRQILKHLLIRS